MITAHLHNGFYHIGYLNHMGFKTLAICSSVQRTTDLLNLFEDIYSSK